jgi:hypothetical protein
MKILDALNRWRQRRAARAAARMKFELVIYFNGPATIWAQRPHEGDVICRRRFRWRIFAEVWARQRLRDFDRCDFSVSEIVA